MTQDKTKEYKERLLKSFPINYRSDVETVFKIIPLGKTDLKLYDRQAPQIEELIHPGEWTIKLNGEQLTIPYRQYFKEPDIHSENNLTGRQKAILNCIFLRHSNGYLREKRLKKLVHNHESWIIPFTIQLLGEYVYKILEVLDEHINEKTLDDYHLFTEENLKYWQLVESRMISYWNEYYSWKFPKLKEYLGTALVERIKTANT